MREKIVVQLNLSVPTRTIILFVAALLLVGVTPELGSENVTLSTYYPAPSGVYNQMITTGKTFMATGAGQISVGTTNPATTAMVDVEPTASNARPGMWVDTHQLNGQYGLHIYSQGGYGSEPLQVRSNSTFFSAADAGGTPRFAINNDNNGATLNFFGSDANWFNFMSVDNSGSKYVSFPSGLKNLSLGAGAPGAHAGYLYIDAENAGGCSSITCAANSNCGCGGFASWTPGIYIEGWSYQNRGYPPTVDVTTVGNTTTQVWALDTVAAQPSWGTLDTKATGTGPIWCCPK